jgi:peptidoglycan/LPS O-acetylase OafA/YrhL
MASSPGSAPRSGNDSKRLVEIDALRGIAALSVVLFHYTTRYADVHGHASAPLFTAPQGYLGVNLFFIISGFVIFMTLERTRHALDFVVSRFARLYPAYWAAVALTFAATHLGGMAREQVPLPDALLNLTMLQGFLKVPSVDGAYWTLEVELIFYAWMLLLFRLRMLGRIHWFVGALLALRLVYWWALKEDGRELSWTLGYVLLLDYMPWFGAGIMLYRRARPDADGATPARDLAVLAAAIGTVCVTGSAAMGLFMAALCSIVHAAARGRLGVLKSRVLVALGRVSYALYLVHENLGWTVIHHVEAAGFGANAAIGAALAVSGALAWLVMRWVEQPALRRIRAWRQPRAAGQAGGDALAVGRHR